MTESVAAAPRKLCIRCECRCRCCQDAIAEGGSNDPRQPLIRLEEVEPGVFLFLDYGNGDPNLRMRWVIRAGIYPDGAFQLVSPLGGVTHEVALHLLAREARVAREAMAMIRAGATREGL